MPDLPTLTVSQAHFDRLVAAFPGGTLAEKAAAYKAWLTSQLIDYVVTVENIAIEGTLNEQRDQLRQQVIDSLPARPATYPT